MEKNNLILEDTSKKRNQRADKYYNEILTLEAFRDFVEKNKRRPTYRELSDITKLSIKTVHKNCKLLQTKNVDDFKILTNDIIVSLYQRAKEGSFNHIKLWIQFFEKFNEFDPDKTEIPKIVFEEYQRNKTLFDD